jgi:uncharacterized protein (TIRG00374 family)
MSAAATPLPARRSRLLVAALWLGLTAARVTAARHLPWRSALQQVAHARPGWLIVAVIANAAIIALWSGEWRLLAPRASRVTYARMFECVATMAAVLNSIPFFIGEATGVAFLIARAGLSRGGALSVLAMDQLLSGFGKLAVFAGTALIVPLPAWLRTGILSLAIGVTVLLALLLPVAHRWRQIHGRLERWPARWRRLLSRIVSVGEHLDAIRETRRVWRVCALALGKKSLELAGIIAVQSALGVETSFATGMLVLACVSVSNIAPIAPGNVGVYEAAAFAGYRYSGVAADTALGLAVVQHLCFLTPMWATGYITLTLRQLLPARQPS